MAISIKLDDEIKSRVKQLAQKRDRTAHWIMKEAIRDYIEREESKERFIQEALASWQSYQITGKHLSENEVHDWLKNWGNEPSSKMTTCHD